MIRLFVLVFGLTAGARADLFSNFSSLSKARQEGKDFKVTVKNRRAPVTALAIHGGTIEFFTDKLAESFAASDQNLYALEGLTKGSELHVTSTHFDDPRARELVRQSALCVSFHGQRGNTSEDICVGGSNEAMATRAATALKTEFPEIGIEFPCQRLPGTHPGNVGNACSTGGVQLEFSMKLLRSLSENPDRAQKVIRVLRRALIVAGAQDRSAHPADAH